MALLKAVNRWLNVMFSTAGEGFYDMTAAVVSWFKHKKLPFDKLKKPFTSQNTSLGQDTCCLAGRASH